MKSIILIGRRWCSRTGIYHSVQIIMDGETIHRSDIKYGASDQYIQSGYTWLAENKYLIGFKPNAGNFTAWCQARGINVVTEGIDVPRKRNL